MCERNDPIRELLAAEQHAVWARWMRYQFSVCKKLPGEALLFIPSEKVMTWARQMTTVYADLSEKEKDSDREQADKIVAVLAHIEAKSEPCVWTQGADSQYRTACGPDWSLGYVPSHYGYYYCPSCGRPIREVPNKEAAHV